MKIGIVGMGVAGSYLASRLKGEHKVLGFERLQKDSFDAVCAWGTSKYGIASFAEKVGLDFDDYVLQEGKELCADLGRRRVYVPLKGLCCFDKLQFIRDLAEGTEVAFDRKIMRDETMADFDLVMDATGLSRPLLPRIKSDLVIPCVQHKVKFREIPFDDFYVKPFPGLSGYFWYFPLGNGYAHVGGGDLHKRHIVEIESFLRKHGGERLNKVGRPVRIVPPSMCQPFRSGNVVGVGETIGTVYPLLGEGIIPSLQCAELLAENLYDLESYEKQVLEKFKVYDSVYRFVVSRFRPGISVYRQIMDLGKIFLHMSRNEKRYGMTTNLVDLLKVVFTTQN